MASLTDAEFVPAIIDFADVDFIENFEYNFSVPARPKKLYHWSEYDWSFEWRQASVSCFMKEMPCHFDPDLSHPNMRPYPNIISDEEFCMFLEEPEPSHPVVVQILNSTFDTNAAFSSDALLEHVFLWFINLHHRVTVDADSFAIDSYMLDVDELQLGAFRFIRG